MAQQQQKVHSERDALASAVQAENLSGAGSALLQMASELRLTVALQDTQGTNADADAMTAAVRERCAHQHASLAELQRSLSLSLMELEKHYEGSLCKTDPRQH